jgi:hypothetical protein
MKLLIKLAITALLANAMFRVGTEYVVHYKFRDLVREAAMFQAKSEDDLRDRVIEIANANGVPQSVDKFTVRRNGRQSIINGTYTKKIEVVPGFPIDWKFDWDIDAYKSDAPLLPGAPQPKPSTPAR